MDEVRDRYGPPPVPLLNLADYGRIRVMADQLGIETIDREGTVIAIKFREKAKVDPMRVINLVRERGDLQLKPPVSLKMDLKQPVDGAGAGHSARPASGPRATVPGTRHPVPGPRPPVPGTRRPRSEPAWWTARATAGEVTAGFSKAEILKPKEEDPRAPGGILERVTGLLEDLSDR
jgi:hypothetical protein